MLNKGMEQILGVTLCKTICGCLGFKMFKSVHDHMWVCGLQNVQVSSVDGIY